MDDEIVIRAPGYDDPSTDKCAPRFKNDCTVAILEINGLTIPLSLDRVNDLIDKLNQFSKIVFCYQCYNFIPSKSGWNYGGSCKLSALKDGKFITVEDAGYNYCVDCMHTCSNAIPRKENQNAESN